jgi:hypothetical protein
MSFKRISQQKDQKTKQLSYEFHLNAEELLRRIPSKYLTIFNIIVGYCQKHKIVYVSQEQIAIEAHTAREVVNRAFKFFKKEGFISMKYRHMRTSIYNLSPYFNLPDVRHRLGHLIPNLRSFLLSCIFAQFAACQPNQQVTQYKNSKDIYIAKGDKRMQSQEISPISPAIKNITCFNLTLWGQIRLSVFPDEAIKYADAKFKLGKDIRDRFGYFFSLARNYCEENKIKVDYAHANRLAFILDMPLNPIMLKTNNPKRETKPKYVHKTSVTHHYPTHNTKMTIKSTAIEDIKKKEAEMEKRYKESVANRFKPVKTASESNPQAEEFRKMLGISPEGSPQ